VERATVVESACARNGRELEALSKIFFELAGVRRLYFIQNQLSDAFKLSLGSTMLLKRYFNIFAFTILNDFNQRSSN
jgi:hypothetical protein